MSSKMHPDVQLVIEEAQRWGVKTRVLRSCTAKLLNAPFSIFVGCDVPKGTIYIARTALMDATVAPGLLHELSHVIQGVLPPSIFEIDSGMLYVEYLTARRLKLRAWEGWMQDYGLLDGSVWGKSVRESKRDSLRVSRDGALKAGLVRGTRLTYKRVPYEECPKDSV